MSEEKKTYNGRVQFWEHGYVGVKDYDDTPKHQNLYCHLI